MKIKLKENVKGLPSHSSCCGYHEDVRDLLNQGKVAEVDAITDAAKPFVEEVKSQSKSGGTK